jgi:hypothetical protein
MLISKVNPEFSDLGSVQQISSLNSINYKNIIDKCQDMLLEESDKRLDNILTKEVEVKVAFRDPDQRM